MSQWSIVEQYSPPTLREAMYFFYLPHDNEVVYHTTLSPHVKPQRYYGGLDAWLGGNSGAPIIPVDTHLAIVLGWVDSHTLVRNMEYVSDNVRAAIKLVT